VRFGLAVEDGRVLLRLDAQVDEQRGVAAVIENQIRRAAIVPGEQAMRVVPVLFECLALLGEDGCALDGEGGGGVVLGRKDIAAHPANFGAQGLQGLDEHGRLDRHVQAAGDAGTLERLDGGVFLAHGHQARHLVLGDGDLLAAPVRQRQVGNGIVFIHGLAVGLLDGLGRLGLLGGCILRSQWHGIIS